jgi:hypothetical protein
MVRTPLNATQPLLPSDVYPLLQVNPQVPALHVAVAWATLVQTLHAVPPVPQLAVVVPGKQVVPSQQPLGQLVAVHTHEPATHTCPVAQTTGLLPTQVPFWQVSV